MYNNKISKTRQNRRKGKYKLVKQAHVMSDSVLETMKLQQTIAQKRNVMQENDV